MDSKDNNKLDIGNKIRNVRKIRGITLEKLSKDVGMSYSYLSELENDKHSISINNLQKLAEYFKVDLIHFLEKTNRESILIRKNERNSLETDDGIIFQAISTEDARNMQVTFVTIPPNTPEKGQRNIHRHAKGEEFITVTKGEIVVEIEEDKFILKKGDSVIFPSNKEHVIYSRSRGGEIILISAPPYKNYI